MRRDMNIIRLLCAYFRRMDGKICVETVANHIWACASIPANCAGSSVNGREQERREQRERFHEP